MRSEAQQKHAARIAQDRREKLHDAGDDVAAKRAASKVRAAARLRSWPLSDA